MELEHVTWALTTVVALFWDLNASSSWESLLLSSHRMTVTIGEIVLEAYAGAGTGTVGAEAEAPGVGSGAL